MKKIVLVMIFAAAINLCCAYKSMTTSDIRSPQYLIDLALMDLNIFNILSSEYSEVLSNKIPLLKEYLDDYEESAMNSTAPWTGRDAAVVISKNPIMAYRMIRRYTKLLRSVYTNMRLNNETALLTKIANGKRTGEMLSIWPCDDDLSQAMEAIIRLHQVYDLDLEEFTSGNIMGTITNVQLKSTHCQEIGEYALNLEHFYSGVLWLEIALSKAESEQGSSNNLIQTKTLLTLAIESHDVAWSNPDEFYYDIFSERLNETISSENRKTMKKVDYEKNHKNAEREGPESDYDILAFWELCNGKNHQTENEISQLFCMYETKSHPVWTINPLKVEYLSLSPYIIQIHDVLSESFIKDLKEEVIPDLKPSGMGQFGHSASFVSNYRTSVQAWLDDNVSKNALVFSRHLELITGLNIVPSGSAEMLQIASYAFGGYYGVHMDAVKEFSNSKFGNRLATIMTYLEDVEIGGFTAFPRIGISARPIKGSALIWFNMLKNGEIDEDTHHGSCPVVLGHKWIATKWIRANAQMLTRPCGLNPDE